ncbi:MAG: carboxypeptidase regulatory-like domain-containing protein, partial [Vicinamibacteraceae bacterium]
MVIIIRRSKVVSFGILLLLLWPAALAAAPVSPTPQADTGSLMVEVRDVLAGVLPGATITVVGPLPGTATLFDVTNGRGEVVFDGLAPGRYRLRVEMPSFETAEVDDVEIRAGRRARQAVTLSLSRFTEEVVVDQDDADRRLTDSFTETMSEEEIDQLPDDPEELATLLRELAGPDAELRVNGFEDGELPPKSQIQAIRVRSDPFSPDVHGAGRPRVEIITKPGSSAWENRVDFGFRDQSMDARNYFAPERGVGQTRRWRWSVSGPLIKNKMSIALDVRRTTASDAQTIVAIRRDGTPNDIVNQEFGRLDVGLRLEHGLTDSHTLRFEYQRRGGDQNNLGVGQFDLPERAYTSEDFGNILRVSEMGTFGKTAFNEFRVEYSWDGEDVRSSSDAVTIDVQNAFTSGGAQRGGGARQRELEIENDLELAVSDRYKMRVGFEGEVGWSRTDEWENRNGTFEFASLADYDAGRPLQFRQRLGNPLIDYSRYELGWYFHNEIRLRENLEIGLGLRHEFQSHLDDWNNVGPRASLAWTPGGDEGKTTISGGFGISYEWYDTSIYEETLRVDGVQQ